ncbi:hypothetical protein BGW39_001902, partial [Mortierella sp. 14UC]
MMKDAGWTGVKLLSSGSGSDKYAEISYSTNRASTMDVFIANNISCSNITHSGRQSGTKEGIRLNRNSFSTPLGRPLNASSSRPTPDSGEHRPVLPCLFIAPTQWALAVAGLRNKPFHLTRNEVDPSLELQRMLFPFIENVIGGRGSDKNAKWQKDFDREMNQFDPNNTKELEAVRPEPLVPLPKSKSDSTRRPTVYKVRSHVSFVLHLMLRFRRVLLQDAAVYLFLGETQGLNSPLLETPGSVFQTEKFKLFREDVVAALLMERVELPKDIPDNMLRALEISSPNQSGDMQELRKVPISVNDKLAQ